MVENNTNNDELKNIKAKIVPTFSRSDVEKFGNILPPSVTTQISVAGLNPEKYIKLDNGGVGLVSYVEAGSEDRSPEKKKNKLVIVIGDYGGGTVESAFKNGQDLSKLRSADSADLRVFNEVIRQDPSVSNVITLPIARQFSPNSAGQITKLATEWAFKLLEDPKSQPGYEHIEEVTIVANVAPGIKSLKGGNVGSNDKNGANLDREAFVYGSISRDGITVKIGSTNAFLEGEGHTLGALTELEKKGYNLSEFYPIGGDEVKNKLIENGQFRSRWSLAYMAKGEVSIIEGGVISTAKEHNGLLSGEILKKDKDEARKVFDNMKGFVPVISGDAKEGFITVISSSAELNDKLQENSKLHLGRFINGFSYDGNETVSDVKKIKQLSGSDQENYRLTRQAFLAANAAIEFDKTEGAGTRTVIVDTRESFHNDNRYEAELENGSRIIAGDPKIFALALHKIESKESRELRTAAERHEDDRVVRTVKKSYSITNNGQKLSDDETAKFLSEAKAFKDLIADKVLENDPYRNVKLASTFGERLGQVKDLMKNAGIDSIPSDKALELTITAKTDNETQERKAYYVPTNTGSFGVWGHAKLSSGSTTLEPGSDKDGYQAEIFTPGCPTAGALIDTVPGVTSINIESVKLIDKSLLERPGTTISGKNRQATNGAHVVNEPQGYNKIHGEHVRRIVEQSGSSAGIVILQ